MKLPSLKVRAKVDTGIKKRGGLSAKEFRRNSSKKTKTTLKHIEDLRLAGRTNSSRKDRSIKESSLQDVLDADEFRKTFK